ncbi:uncharacterized protein Dwil_GK17466 [Drosophila willistoni]|uniref:Chitin-binding type-2 domain-containing protein n=1 Tax=Drosophila willistoni TaxID=7260 RepID=B4MMD6_DROWI|nr:flocculation protein FLO11 [Drosophila willistoni]EDW73281.1 uncharacterized protein Dwil_GK17466 [Drosophila willistoni]
MLHKWIWLISFYQLGLLVSLSRATCNVCNTVNSMACYSVNQTQACDASNLPTGSPYDCPSGYVCVSGSNGVLCQPEASASSEADCQDCNKCDSTNTFACTSTNTFALCLGTTTPQNSIGTCADGYVCNVNYTQICGLEADGVMPTCSYADDTTTTTTTTTTVTTSTTATISTSDASTYCSAIESQGKYPVGYDPDTTCHQYIYCFINDGSWDGQTYTCPGSLYFSSSSNMCVSTMPANCAAWTGSTSTTTTVAPTTSNPDAYCAAMQSEGYYPMGTDASTTCHEYVYCFLLSGSWNGQMYECAGNLYYDSSSKLCVSSLPATCSTTVASLTLNGVTL